MCYDEGMKRLVMIVLGLCLLGGCLNQPQGFQVSEPGGYNYTTGNQRDHHTYERYSGGEIAVRITLRMIELPGGIYDPQFDASAFFDRIGWTDVVFDGSPRVQPMDEGSIVTLTLQDAKGDPVTIWVINLNSPFDVWAEVRGHPQAVTQAFTDWMDVWNSLEYIYF
jgi:hypothetical protein